MLAGGHDEKLRQAIQMQLNRGEFRHIPIQNHRERQKAANLCAIAIEIIAKGAYWFLFLGSFGAGGQMHAGHNWG